jgi:hypothetical protein
MYKQLVREGFGPGIVILIMSMRMDGTTLCTLGVSHLFVIKDSSDRSSQVATVCGFKDFRVRKIGSSSSSRCNLRDKSFRKTIASLIRFEKVKNKNLVWY